MTKKLALLLLGGTLFFSCQEKEEAVKNSVASRTLLSLRSDGLSLSNSLSNVTSLLYDGDLLIKKSPNLSPDSEGYYPISTDKFKADKLLLVAGDHSLGSDRLPVDYSDLLNECTPSVDFKTNFPQLYYTGERKLGSIANAVLELNLTRSLARIDFKKITQLDVIVDSCVISNLADKSYWLPGNSEPIQSINYRRLLLGKDAFTNLDNGIEGAAYIYESNGAAPQITIYAQINNIKHELKTTLPAQVKRNTRYQIGINGNGAIFFADLNVLEWEEGGSSEAKPDNYSVKIDVENSLFPKEVSASATRDTLYIDANFGGSFVLALDAPTETEVKVENSQMVVTPVVSSRATYTGNLFNFSLDKNEINRPTTSTYLYVKGKAESQYYKKHLVIVRKGYRTRFENVGIATSQNKIIYPDYTDGDLATISATASAIASVITTSTDEQFNWVRSQQTESGYLLEGAFKPNDVEATGQLQNSIVKVTYEDGLEEEFLMSRKRHSIPVITQGGLYWAKYNMRGNSKSYVDQIGFDNDIPRNEFYDYLKTCSDEEFAYYVGAEYRGTSTQGLYLKRDPLSEVPALLYEGYSDIPDGQISNGAADAHCPPGYKMPSLGEWQHIYYTGGKMTIPASGAIAPFYSSAVSPAASDPNSTSNSDKNRFNIHRHTRESVIVDGVELKNVGFFKLVDVKFYEGEEMVFLGFGNQNTATQITWGQLITPIVTTGFSHFVLNFANNSITYGNLGGPGAYTRSIRCVKSPTNFILD
ncbi:MAG: hypothetical protein ACRCZY_08665 [Phocaeicola sp.]